MDQTALENKLLQLAAGHQVAAAIYFITVNRIPDHLVDGPHPQITVPAYSKRVQTVGVVLLTSLSVSNEASARSEVVTSEAGFLIGLA
jgi:hypothetical protein